MINNPPSLLGVKEIDREGDYAKSTHTYKQNTLCTVSACFLPAILFWVASVSDNDQFYFGDAWLEAHGGARRALTGPVFLAQRMFTCRSDVDAKS